MKKPAPSLPYRLILRQFAIQTGLFLTLFGAVVSFQNCGGPVLQQNTASSESAELPFAFESEMDQIAYMSCSSITNGVSHFNFKVGAYAAPAGLRFRDPFKTATKSMTATARSEALQASSVNGGTHQQLSIRQLANLQNPLGNAITMFPTALTEQAIESTVNAQTGTMYANFFPAQPPGYQNIETQIAYPGSTEQAQSELRTHALSGGDGILSSTFSSGSSAIAAAPTPSSTSSIYGRGYALSFGVPGGISGMPAKILTGIQERNLENGQTTTSNWDCSSNYVFKIVRAQDRGLRTGSTCSDANFNDVTGGPTQDLVYKTVRKMLNPIYWAVDVVNRCIVAKTAATSGLCYPTTATDIKYDGSACIPGSNTCPHYLSVCKRN